MANSYFYTNIAVPTTLSGSITGAATTASVASTTGWPTSYPYIIGIDFGASNEELVKVTNNVAGTLTIERAFGGTSAGSHSTGAVVRHVYNAQDATDFRTHEAATTAHGVAGVLVGTTDTQTLTNKTLSGGVLSGTFTGSPTLSGNVTFSGTLTGAGAMAGTFSGTPTFSGNVSFTGSTTAATVTGEIAHSNLYRGTRAASTDSQLETRVTGDSNARWFVRASGQHFWGSGSSSADTTIYRNATNSLTTEAQFRNTRTNGTDVAWQTQRIADTNARWYTTADGVLTWGDGAGTNDTNLYRSAANTLATDDSLSVGGSLTVAGVGQTRVAYKTADTNVSSNTTPSADPHLTLTVAANAVYVLEGALFVSSSSTTPDILMAFDVPAASAGIWHSAAPAVTSTADPDSVRTIATSMGSSNSRNFGISTASQQYGILINGTLETAGNSGSLTLWWSQNTSSASATQLKIYSWIKLTRVS